MGVSCGGFDEMARRRVFRPEREGVTLVSGRQRRVYFLRIGMSPVLPH